MTDKTPWTCKGTIEKYRDPVTNEPRACRQKLMFFDADMITLEEITEVVEIRCPRCKAINGGYGWPSTN